MDTERIDCERCAGLGEACENSGLELGARGQCSLACKRWRCDAVECVACGGLGYAGCRECGEPIDAERWGNYCRDARQALCEHCECRATAGSATSGNGGVRAVEPTEPGRVRAVDWDDEPTVVDVRGLVSADYDGPAPVRGAPLFDDDNETRELPAVEV